MPWLVFTNLYVALCGAALTFATYPLLGLPARVDAVVCLVFFATLLIYNLDRLTEPRPGDSLHEQWVESHRKFLWGCAIIGVVGCVVFALRLPTPAQRSLALPGVVALGYCLPAWRWRGRWCRLKQLPGAKLLLIAGVWTYATAWLPAITTQANAHPASVGLGLLLSGRLTFILAVALPFDIPDMARDKTSGIVTLPQCVGLSGARQIALALAVIHLILAVFYPWPIAAGLLVNGLVVLAVLGAMSDRRGVYYYAIALDGLLLFQSAFIMLALR